MISVRCVKYGRHAKCAVLLHPNSNSGLSELENEQLPWNLPLFCRRATAMSFLSLFTDTSLFENSIGCRWRMHSANYKKRTKWCYLIMLLCAIIHYSVYNDRVHHPFIIHLWYLQCKNSTGWGITLFGMRNFLAHPGWGIISSLFHKCP